MNEIIRSGTALLPYAVETFPPELNASTPGKPVTATLKVVVGAGLTRSVRCDRLTVKLRIGEGASAWTGNRTALDSGVVGGESPGQGDGWTKYDGYPEGDWQVFEFEPTTTAVFDGNWRLTLNVFNIEVNSAPGWAEFQVVEKTSTSGATTDKATNAQYQKAPSAFVFHSFHPKDLLVGNGDRATLLWQGTQDAAYTMYWGETHEELKFGPDQPFGEWRSPELHTPTGFMLQARYTEDGKTYERTLTTTVSVIKPDLELRHLTVNGTLTAKGAVTAEGTLTANSTITANGALTVDGDTALNGHVTAVGSGKIVRIRELRGPVKSGGQTADPALLIKSDVTVNSANLLSVRNMIGLGTYPTIDIEGHLKLSSSGRTTTINGPLVAKGNVTLDQKSLHQPPQDNKLTVKSAAAMEGATKFTGPVQGYRTSYSRNWGQNTAPTSSNKYTATAPTDGLLYGQILCYDNTRYNDNIGFKGSLHVTVAGRTYRCDAPILRQSGAGAQHYTLTAPVRQGDSIAVHITNDTTSIYYSKLAIGLVWRPFGQDSPLAGFTRTAEAEPSIVDNEPAPPDSEATATD
ncbi:hypothetical protein [Streptomyces gilvosporeus]|uniref:Uncharacterized protein n=1 Tax=Streptomyces gilvosporeus TaxID=553510 RepID=A0A1V0TJZ2_9ACTN|nr:hypothetical protein [Streptomyces gilvosporeus]ARF53244.1 hypothetical protein B1H19_02860 [Streptomyces gilvosporeus]